MRCELPLSLILAALAATPALAETVSTHEFQEDYRGYPCYVAIRTQEGPRITFQLSDYENVWSLKLWVTWKPERYRDYFDEQGLRDESAFSRAFRHLDIGGERFEVDEASLFEVQRAKVDGDTGGIFSLEEPQRITPALEAMMADGVGVPGLIEVTGTVEALAEFRTCSYAALGLNEGERPEFDARVELRSIFEDAFVDWVRHATQAESCGRGRIDDEEIATVVDRAADAFHPGLLEWGDRSAFRDRVLGNVAMARSQGSVEAMEGCFMVGDMARIARMPVDAAIEAAEGMD